jgi:hypothetical protein
MVRSRSLLRVCCLLGATAGFSSFAAAQTGGPGVPFLSHQAVYDLSLQKARGNAAVNAAKGRILYKFGGSACEGYATEFRQVSQLDSGEDKSTVSDLRSTSWEDGNAKSYRFKVDSRTNDGDPSYVDGIAERSDDGTITVKLKQPVTKTFTLDKETVFPTEQIRRIIEAAKAGKRILELAVYDGSDNGEKIYNTMTVIGQPIPGNHAPAAPDVSTSSDKLKSLTRWPVTVSYFDRTTKPNSGEQTPVYAMSFELYEDGVSRALVLDYNDFVIAGTMDKLDVNETKPCQ